MLDYKYRYLAFVGYIIQSIRTRCNTYLKNILMKDIDKQLLSAASAGNARKINKLIGLGANINCTDSDGRTPIMLAAISKSLNSIMEISAHNPDIWHCDKMGYTFEDYLKEQPMEDKKGIEAALLKGLITKKRRASSGEGGSSGDKNKKPIGL